MSKSTKKRTVIYSNVKENKRLAEEKNKKKEEQINLNDEVIIGFNSKKNNSVEKIKKKPVAKSKPTKNVQKDSPERKKKTKDSNVKEKKVKKQKSSNVEEKTVKEPKKEPVKKKKTKTPKSVASQVRPKKNVHVPMWFRIAIPICVVAIGVFAFLRSPLFNIKEINVKIDNNAVITTSDIEELSNIHVGQNMFSISKRKAVSSIKSNAYIESVKIKRIIPSKVKIEVVERTVEFQVQTDEGYYYIDKQGVIIDKKSEKYDCVAVIGQKTEGLTIGKNLNDEDIQGLSEIQQIIQEAKNNDITEKITRVDISNHDDYKIYFDEVGIVAHIGDTSLMNDKMTRVAKILKVENGVEGEIFVNVDFNNGKYPYFRESV